MPTAVFLFRTRILQNAPKVRTSGPLVEDGISKAERTEFLRKQREERKANRKKGMHVSAARGSSIEPAVNAGLRNRRTSAPAMMSSAGGTPPRNAAVRTPSTPPLSTTGGLHSAQGHSTPPVEDNGTTETNPTPPPGPSAGEQDDEGAPASSPAQADAPPITDLAAAPTVRAPPPRMFNPTAVPPPVAPPSVAASTQGQAPRHPSIAFSVNETVERALAQAKRETSLAERRATFWKCRFREVAVWAATFAVLSFASDHGFEDC